MFTFHYSANIVVICYCIICLFNMFMFVELVVFLKFIVVVGRMKFLMIFWLVSEKNIYGSCINYKIWSDEREGKSKQKLLFMTPFLRDHLIDTCNVNANIALAQTLLTQHKLVTYFFSNFELWSCVFFVHLKKRDFV